MEEKTAISFANVAARYDGTPDILTDVSFNISGGGFYFLSGASGAGKTTLLRLIYQLHKPARGQIKIPIWGFFFICCLQPLFRFGLMPKPFPRFLDKSGFPCRMKRFLYVPVQYRLP